MLRFSGWVKSSPEEHGYEVSNGYLVCSTYIYITYIFSVPMVYDIDIHKYIYIYISIFFMHGPKRCAAASIHISIRATGTTFRNSSI